MTDTRKPTIDGQKPVVYQMRLQGHLGCQWTDWFEGLTITLCDDGDTLLTGPVLDQAALHGLLKKVRDLGMTLVSVVRLGPDKNISPEVEQEKSGGETRFLPETGFLDQAKRFQSNKE